MKREKIKSVKFHRQLVYYRLLSGYPLTRDQIIAEARVDLCPAFRGFTWCALLGVSGATRETYRFFGVDTVVILTESLYPFCSYESPLHFGFLIFRKSSLELT